MTRMLRGGSSSELTQTRSSSWKSSVRRLRQHPTRLLKHARSASRSTTMRETKRKRLKANGWRVGSVSDFLELTPEESAYLELKLALAEALRSKRQSKGLTQIELAQRVHSSQSRVAKMEAGDPTVSLDLLIKSFFAMG